jgi:YteA family regulatory protein
VSANKAKHGKTKRKPRKGWVNMEPFEKYRKALLQRKQEIEHELKQTESFGLNIPYADENASGELSQYDNHPADEATALYEREKDIALKGHLEEELEDIEVSLAKIKNGTYGVCEVTGQQIPTERLDALPTARTIKEATSNQMISEKRPVEEDVLRNMEKEYYTGSEESEYNEQNAYHIVASFNENSMTYEDSSLIDNEDGVGYVELVENIASTGIEGYTGDENVHFQRNIQYDQLMNDVEKDT